MKLLDLPSVIIDKKLSTNLIITAHYYLTRKNIVAICMLTENNIPKVLKNIGSDLSYSIYKLDY